MANKNKAKTENGGVPRKSKRATDSTKMDIEAFSETWNSVGHLLTPISDADIEWAKSREKSQEKPSLRKQTVSACLAAIIAATISVAADSVFTETVNGIEWTYRVVNGEVILGQGGENNVRAIDTSTFGAIDIPLTLNGYPVTGVGNHAFRACRTITLVSIPQCVKSIGSSAFRECSGLMALNIPESVTNIGSYVFYCSSGVTMVHLPDNIEEIKNSMFEGCGSLVDVNLPSCLKRIGDRAFQGCHSLKEMVIPQGVTTIITQAFYDCGGLTNVVIPRTVKHLGNQAFRGVSSLKEIVIPGSVSSFGDGIFRYCSSVTNVVVENGLPGIASAMFQYCYNLKNVILPTSITSIGNYAFSGCKNLPRITLPETLQTIGNYSFEGCKAITEISIPANVQVVGGYAFKSCTNLKSIKFLGDAPMVDAIAFEDTHPDCTAYVSRKSAGWGVAIPGEWMGIKIDYYDPALYTVRFDANGGSLGDATNEVSYGEGEAFRNLPVPSKDGCSFVGWFTTADGDTCVTEGMLVSGNMTLYAHWNDAAPELTIENGVLVHVDLNGEKSVEIPSVVTSISAAAFSECQQMERVTIPESVTSIPLATFANCDKLWSNWYKAMANCSSGMESVSLTVTNVVVHYIATSTQSESVTPPETTGIVSVIAEVTSVGPVAFASTWAAQYPDFEPKFGNDFTAALTKQTGKRDGAGNAMLVWQDYVAGTDPTKPDDKFTASITFDAQGNPVISYSPELSAAETAKRIYRKFGKVKLNDKNWTPIASGEEANYNFFRVTVEMK